jgi:hypothetical protein
MKKESRQPHGEICGAKMPDGTLCQNPPEPGKRRCWNHGGAPGSGAPRGNQNAIKHGYYSAAAREERRRARELLAEVEELLKRLKG